MKVLLNAASIREGGSRVVLRELVAGMAEQRNDVEWLVAAHAAVASDLPRNPRIGLIEPGRMGSGSEVLRWYERDLPRAVRERRVDAVFSITNYLPLRPLACPTVLLIQHAGHFSEEFDRLQRDHLAGPVQRLAWDMKSRWVRRSARAATILTVQTRALADAIARQTGRPRHEIRVVPHGPGAVSPMLRRARRGGATTRIGYVAKWGVQKNFAVLLDAMHRLRSQGRDVCLVLTLDSGHADNRRLLERAQHMGLGGVIENHGELGPEAVSQLYATLDMFVFPTLVESFGYPMLEAMACGLPLLAAETASNREVAGNGGRYFQPHDESQLAGAIASWIVDEEDRTRAGAAAFERAREFSWQRAARETLALIEAAMGQGRTAREAAA